MTVRDTLLRSVPLIALAALVGCTEPPKAVHAPAAPPPSAVAVPTPVVAGDWKDMPLAAGGWAYAADAAGSSALFGRPGAEADLILRCERSQGRVLLSIGGLGPAAITVATTSGSGGFAAQALPGTPPRLGFELAATDPMLDRIAFSRGRFALIVGGGNALVMPAWAEPVRVVEDCRR